MSEEKKTYATVAGFIQFEVKPREVNGQTVRDIRVRAIGSQTLVSATVWPQWDAIPLNEGDFVVIDGQYRKTTKTNDEGVTRTYHNIGVNKLLVNGTLCKPAPRETVNTDAGDDAADDDIPF